MEIVDLSDFATKQELNAQIKAVELSAITQVANLLEEMGLIEVTRKDTYVEVKASSRLLEIMATHGVDCDRYPNTGTNTDDTEYYFK